MKSLPADNRGGGFQGEPAPELAPNLRDFQGDLDDLLARVAPEVRAYLRQRTGPRVMRFLSLSDIEQEVLLKGRDLLGRLRPASSYEDFRALLLKNADWAIHKAARGMERLEGESAVDTPDRADTEATDGEITREDQRGRLHELIEALPATLSEVVRLRLEGRSFAEIATTVGVHEETARVRYMRASEKLRALTRPQER